ncbi:MAG: NAD(P)/FAD-dependent oxidoreductase [Polyangiaceae bacterium]|nr:NAD(P)/FAD-dependent oxidoreductase [Polyangiaceae bacterium]
MAKETSNKTSETWDAVVIGSGAGGLTAALALARAGQKVLVLEQHYLPGGWTHSFSLEGYRFSPGVHYIGCLEEGGSVRNLYEGLGIGADLEFCELNPDGFDHFLIAGERFDQPKGLERWKARLAARFPHERDGIRRYFEVVEGIDRDVRRIDRLSSFPAALTIPFRAPHLIRWGLRTLDALLDTTIHDPRLRAVLSAQAGNHGLAPSRVSLPLHCSMSTHYFDGAWYPRGGAKRLSAAYIKALKRRGSHIRLRSPVTRILVEHDRVVGVEVAGNYIVKAKTVVCNAQPAVVLGTLLESRFCERELKKVRKMRDSVGLLSIFCGVRGLDLSSMGFDSGNYWFYRHDDVNRIYERVEDRMPGEEIDGLFLTITSLKDPGHGPPGTHTLEMFTFVPYEPFAGWEGTDTGGRDERYDAFKRKLGAKMLRAAEEVVPTLRAHLDFVTIGTPLTNDFYCRTHRGGIYGTAKTPWQVGPFSLSTTGPVDGLFFCGSSILSHGVAGASYSGLLAAQQVLGLERPEDCLGPPDGSIRLYPADAPETWLEGAAACPKPGRESVWT